jgi:hypothetical protein
VTLFAWVMVGLFVAFLAGILLLGLRSPRSGADVLGWGPTRSPELEGQNDEDDLEQMLDAANALRRRRGAPERTRDDVAESVQADRSALRRRDGG